LPRPPQISAVLRYPVSQADLTSFNRGVADIQVRYRDGAGTVLVNLIQVSLTTGEETALLGLDSRDYTPQNDFHVQFSPNTQFPGVDFQNNAYYVALTLTGPGGPVVTTQPAVHIMQILAGEEV
jgi:hypothetical protein